MNIVSRIALTLSLYAGFLLPTYASVSGEDDLDTKSFSSAGFSESNRGRSKKSISNQGYSEESDIRSLSSHGITEDDEESIRSFSTAIDARIEKRGQKLNQIYTLKSYFKKGFLEITPESYKGILEHTLLYTTAFESYDRGIALKGWKESDDIESLLKLVYYFLNLKSVKWFENKLLPKTTVDILSDIIQHYEDFETLDVADTALSYDEIKELLSVLPNPVSLKILNIKASTLHLDAQSEIKKKYPNLAEFVVGTETPLPLTKPEAKREESPAIPQPRVSEVKREPKAVKETPVATTEIKIEKVDEPKAPSLKPLYRPTADPQKPIVTTGTPKALEIKEEEKRAAEMKITIPLVAKGYEDIYKRFFKGALIYRPQEGSDVGMIALPIAQLANPLEGTFDLSQCGDAGKYLSIATGYRKSKIAGNADKVEIWIAPRFLIEKELKTTASYFQEIFSKWSESAQVGIFWTGGWWDNLYWYDYLTTENFEKLSNNNIYEKYKIATATRLFRHPLGWFTPGTTIRSDQKKFHVIFVN